MSTVVIKRPPLEWFREEIPVARWSGSGPYTLQINVDYITANTIVDASLDSTITNLTSQLNVSSGNGYILLSTDTLPSGQINVTIMPNGESRIVRTEVLADCYSSSQVDSLVDSLENKIGTTNISAIADGTLTGAISGINNIVNLVDITHGGSGATTAAAARTNLGITPINIGAVQAVQSYNGNIDDLRSIGVYYLAGATGTGTGAGPNNFWGMLEVAGYNDGSRAVQLYIDIWSDSAMFRRYSGTWSNWVPLALTTNTLSNNDITSTARGSVERDQSVDITIGSTGNCLIFIQRNSAGGAIYGVNGNVLTPYITMNGVTASLESNNTVLRISNTALTVTYLLFRIGTI